MAKKECKQKYFNIKQIFSNENALYNIKIGERAKGKKYSELVYTIQSYAKKGYRGLLFRRIQNDFILRRGIYG